VGIKHLRRRGHGLIDVFSGRNFLKKNPPKKPDVPQGKQSVWVRPVVAREWVIDKGTGYSFYRRVRIRRGYWRIQAVSRLGLAARAKGGDWLPVTAYMAELQSDYDLDGMDPVYRYHRDTDQVRHLSSHKDPLYNLVWDKPFSSSIPKGNYQAIRVWYIVRDMNLDRHYLYGRTAQDERVTFQTPQAANGRRLALESEIMNEYEEKAYTEMVRFVAWTVYGKSKALKKHKKFRKVSKERGFNFDEKRWSFKRTPTRWERQQAQKALRGRSGFHPVLQADYGGNYRKFLDAMARLSKSERKQAYSEIAWAVRQMEAALDRKRRARKAGRWRE
jgi:hypothetical protein